MRINLGNQVNENIKVLSGRDKGQEFRGKYKLDTIDSTDEKVEVVIPDKFYSVNSSFFLGLFGISVRVLGKEKFKEKYVFDCDSVLMKNIEDGIDRALKESDALRGCTT